MFNTDGRPILIVILAAGLMASQCWAQSAIIGDLPQPWLKLPSPAFANQFKQWKLKFEAGKPYGVPEKGIFTWQGRYRQGIAQLVGNSDSAEPIRLRPVAGLRMYVPAGAVHDPNTLVLKTDLIDILSRPDVSKLIDKDRLGVGELDYSKDIKFARVQDFEAAVRIPGKKEHVVSIKWEIARESHDSYSGIDVWGIFIRTVGPMKPFYLAAAKVYSGEHVNFEFVGIGDLNGDGIDEFVTRVLPDEPEDDRHAILAWEKGALVIVSDTH
jgi:hypothetical protein